MTETLPDPFPTPVVCPQREVRAEWVDYNGHMNMAYYSLAFDNALDHAYDLLGIGEGYVAATGHSHFTLEAHVTYLREVRGGDPLSITWQLLDCDHKRLHFFEHMYHAHAGYLAATSEQISIHVDMSSRRSAPFPDHVQQAFARVLTAHRTLPPPPQLGHVIGIPGSPR